jgi:serine/threonine protein kinase
MNLFLGKKKAPGSQKDWVKFYAAEIIVALEILHKNSIIYRDLKPENVVIDKDGHIKLIDFGFSKRLSSTHKHRTNTNCGTLGYTAPEVLVGSSLGYSFEVDIWSYGILLCELLQG